MYTLLGFLPILWHEGQQYIMKAMTDEWGDVWWPFVFVYFFLRRSTPPSLSLKSWVYKHKSQWKSIFSNLGLDPEFMTTHRVGGQRLMDGRIFTTRAVIIVLTFQASVHDKSDKSLVYENTLHFLELWCAACQLGAMQGEIDILGHVFTVDGGQIEFVLLCGLLGIGDETWVRRIWAKFLWLPGLGVGTGSVSLCAAIMFFARLQAERCKYQTVLDNCRTPFLALINTIATKIDHYAASSLAREPPSKSIMRPVRHRKLIAYEG